MHYLKRLKIILQFKYVFVIILFLIFLLRYIFYNTSFNSNLNYLSGKVIDIKEGPYNTSFIVKTNSNYKVIVAVSNKNYRKNLKYGYNVLFNGQYTSINKNTIFNNFNYQKYLMSKKIFNYFKANQYTIVKKSSGFYTIKNSIYKRISPLKSNSYINALLLSNKSLLSEDEYNSIKDNSIMHLFAISGMHISFIISILSILLKKCNIYISDIVCLIVIFIYSFLVGFPASILRVFIYLIISFICKILNISISNILKLIYCAFLLLIYNPFFIYDLGFIYSFTLMFFIYYYSISDNSKVRSFLKMILLTFLVSSPITIYTFYHLNILSLITNIIFIPIVSIFLFPLSILTVLFPLFDPITYYLFKLLMGLSIFISKFRFLTLVIAKPPMLLILAYYLLLIIHKYKRIYFYIIITSFLFFLNNYFNFYYKIIYLDVRQGDSSLIITPFNKKIVMIDTGGLLYSSYNLSNNIITFLNNMGINQINYLVLTHGDYDHMGEAINLVENFKVEKVIFNCGEYNDLEKELIKELNKKKIKYYSCIKELNIDNNKLYFLQTREYDNENDNSNVIYTELNGYKFMFMGDAGVTTEKEIMNKYNLPDIDVLKVGHHGSKTSSGKDFIDTISPNYSIISVGKNNRYGHPNKEVLNNLKESKIYRTDQDGSIMFKIKNNMFLEAIIE